MADDVFYANLDGWSELMRDVIDTVGVPKMQAVADACNADLVQSAIHAVQGDSVTERMRSLKQEIGDVGKGFMVSTEGDEPLTKRDYRATVITASAAAMRLNAKHNTLLQHFNEAAG